MKVGSIIIHYWDISRWRDLQNFSSYSCKRPATLASLPLHSLRYGHTVEPSCATTSRKQPPQVSDHSSPPQKKCSVKSLYSQLPLLRTPWGPRFGVRNSESP